VDKRQLDVFTCFLTAGHARFSRAADWSLNCRFLGFGAKRSLMVLRHLISGVHPTIPKQ
jgi:hypothetical protein